MSEVEEYGPWNDEPPMPETTRPEAQLPPRNAAAERAVLGACMLDRDAVSLCEGALSGDSFYEPKHELIYEAIMALASTGVAVDALTVGDRLVKDGNVSRVGGVEYLHALTGEVVTTKNVSYWVQIVQEMAMRRHVIDVCQSAAQIAQAGVDDTNALVDVTQAKLSRLLGGRDGVLIGDGYSNLLKSMRESPRVAQTPWVELDSLLGGGLRPGSLYVIGARPGEGKTLMGLQLAAQMAQHGPVAFAALEMSAPEMLNRLVAMQGEIPLSDILRQSPSQPKWERMLELRQEVEALPLWMDDQPLAEATQVKAFARKKSRLANFQGLILDYLQLIPAPSSQQESSFYSGVLAQLKLLAKELQVPVIVLSQLNRDSVAQVRGAKKFSQRPPTLTDFSKTDGVAHHADVVIGLQRMRDDMGQPTGELDVHVLKNRNGITGIRTLLWQAQYARLVSKQRGLF